MHLLYKFCVELLNIRSISHANITVVIHCIYGKELKTETFNSSILRIYSCKFGVNLFSDKEMENNKIINSILESLNMATSGYYTTWLVTLGQLAIILFI